jgi:hypothetical protein
VTDAMVEAAKHAYFNPWPEPRPMRAAITAAIEASGILEENARLRMTIADARLIAVDAQLRATYQRTALERISDLLRQALNKEPTL